MTSEVNTKTPEASDGSDLTLAHYAGWVWATFLFLHSSSVKKISLCCAGNDDTGYGLLPQNAGNLHECDFILLV